MKRYVVVRDGSEIGIFHILSLLEEQDMTFGDYGDLAWAERKLNMELNVPSYPQNVNTEAWFTDKGAERFKDAIDILDILVGEYLSGFDYYFCELDSEPKKEVMYKDEYQIIYYK